MNYMLCAALLIAAATPSHSDEVNVYSYRQPELTAPLFEAFTEATGIDVNVVFLSNGMLERLQSEGKRTPADLIMTTDISRMAAIVDAGLTQPVDNAELIADIPAQYRGADNQWFALTNRARVIYASNDRVADGEITTYEDLADPKWKGRICTRSGTHDYNLDLTSALLAHHGADETKAWLEGFKANLARKPQGNDRAQVKAIWAGECDIAVGNTYYMGLMLADAEQSDWANSVRIMFPTFENAGTHVNVSAMALTAAAPHHDDAIKLMEFLASPEGQSLYANENSEYPVSPAVDPSPVVASWGTFTADTLPLTELPGYRADALRLVEEVNFDG
ncbi:iron ABC transporter substrate-binding protein [Pseudoruegeria sp. SK021]|nr:iron ABC transporter substrate-binding protein [Pseudoruegeria sp. SK021]